MREFAFSILIVLFAFVWTGTGSALASGHRSGESAGRYSGRYGQAHSFSTSRCKTASCFHKHPEGTYLHPNTGGERIPR